MSSSQGLVPKECPNGHPFGPGTYYFGGWTKCRQPCGGAEQGHHHIYCDACGASLWQGHVGAEWQFRVPDAT